MRILAEGDHDHESLWCSRKLMIDLCSDAF